MNNYCQDTCPNNLISRESYEDYVEGRKVYISRAVADRNKSLKCSIGYRQSVNSEQALKNSQANNTQCCARLRKLFGGRI
jgi:hypothetical protein